MWKNQYKLWCKISPFKKFGTVNFKLYQFLPMRIKELRYHNFLLGVIDIKPYYHRSMFYLFRPLSSTHLILLLLFFLSLDEEKRYRLVYRMFIKSITIFSHFFSTCTCTIIFYQTNRLCSHPVYR